MSNVGMIFGGIFAAGMLILLASSAYAVLSQIKTKTVVIFVLASAVVLGGAFFGMPLIMKLLPVILGAALIIALGCVMADRRPWHKLTDKELEGRIALLEAEKDPEKKKLVQPELDELYKEKETRKLEAEQKAAAKLEADKLVAEKLNPEKKEEAPAEQTAETTTSDDEAPQETTEGRPPVKRAAPRKKPVQKKTPVRPVKRTPVKAEQKEPAKPVEPAKQDVPARPAESKSEKQEELPAPGKTGVAAIDAALGDPLGEKDPSRAAYPAKKK